MKDGLTLAVPTGRILGETRTLLAESGLTLPDGLGSDRQLYFPNTGLSFLLVKDKDVPTYVEHGVADVGIVGMDILNEHPSRTLQPLTLPIGRCRMAVAARSSDVGRYRKLPLVRVATKYTRIASDHFHRLGMPITLIPLAGSVELAPVLGLADCIVDVVQTGATLEANGLEIDEVLFESTAAIIVNPSSFRRRATEVRGLLTTLARAAAQESGVDAR